MEKYKYNEQDIYEVCRKCIDFKKELYREGKDTKLAY